MTPLATSTIHRKLVDSLYVEAMLLADEARAYFDVLGRAERNSLEALSRVTFSCESLKVTTRLMHIIAWLLTQRAVQAGEITPVDALSPSRRLGRSTRDRGCHAGDDAGTGPRDHRYQHRAASPGGAARRVAG